MGADATARFAVDLKDGTSGPAAAAAGALQQLRNKIDADTKALREMNAAMKRLQGGTNVSIDSFRSLKAQIDAKKSSLAQASAEFVTLGGRFGKVRKPAEEVKNAVGKATVSVKLFSDGMKGAVPAVGGLFSRVEELSASIGSAGFAGAVIFAVVALAGLAVGIFVAAGKVAGFALAAADAARSSLLLMQAATGSARAGTELAAAVGRVSRGVAISRGEVEGFAKQLTKAKLAGGELESALEAVSIAAAVGQDAGALVSQLELAKKTGASIEAIADKVKTKFGGVAKAQMLGFSVQIAKAKENIGALFSSVKIVPFLEALQRVLSLLDQSTSSGRALKALAETMLSPLFDGLAKGEPAATQFFKGIIIGALRLAIVALTVRNKLQGMFEGVDLAKHATGFKLLGVTALVFAAAIALAAVGVGLIAAVILGSLAAGAAVFGAILAGVIAVAVGIAMLAGKVASGVAGAVKAARAKVSEWMSIGSAFMAGLANGITSGLSAVVGAAKSVAQGAVSAVTGLLKVRSPSQLLEKIGNFTSMGLAKGITGGAGDVEKAAGAVLSIPAESAASVPAGAGGGGGGGSRELVFHVVINGVKDAEQLATDPSLREHVIQLFVDAATQMGAPLAEGT